MNLHQSLWRDNLTHVPWTEPLVVPPQATLRTTIATMRSARAGCVLICDRERIEGIFTEQDLVRRVLAPGADLEAPVSQFMTPQPVTIRRSEPIGSAIRRMHRGHYRHLPIVDDQGRPLGTVSAKRIVQYLIDHFALAVYNLPPQPQSQVHKSREGA